MKRRKIAVTSSGEVTRLVALLLALRDDAELVLLHEDAGPLHGAAIPLGFTARAVGPVPWTDTTGADVVVVLDEEDGTGEELARRCPDALLVVATADSAATLTALQDTLRWPRRRLLGLPAGLVAAGGPAQAAGVAQLIDFVFADRREELDAVVLHTGEHGLQGFHVATVEVGGDGVERFA